MNDLLEIPSYMLNNIVNNAIQEDLGSFGDLTSQSLENNTNEITATITTNQVGVLSGLHCAEMTFNKIDEKINFAPKLNDGDSLEINSVIASITGSALSILSAERTALNFLGHMSGIASQTRNFVNLISNTNASNKEKIMYGEREEGDRGPYQEIEACPEGIAKHQQITSTREGVGRWGVKPQPFTAEPKISLRKNQNFLTKQFDMDQ